MEYYDILQLFDSKEKALLEANENELSDFDKMMQQTYLERASLKIPKEIGEMIQKENNDSDYTIMIHRTSMRSKEETFKNGLPISAGTDLKQTTDRYKDTVELLRQIRYSYTYKDYNSKDSRCFILKVPNTAIEYTPGKTKPILLETDETANDDVLFNSKEHKTVILPEYILGSVEFQGEDIIGFEKNPNYIEIHNYKNEGLVCPDELITDYIIKNNDKKEMSDEQINQIIAIENEQYSEKHKKEYTTSRTESEIKAYSKKNMILSKFNNMVNKIKDFFTKDKTKEEEREDVGK